MLHQRARDLHLEAAAMKEAVLGKASLEVATSWQEIATSLVVSRLTLGVGKGLRTNYLRTKDIVVLWPVVLSHWIRGLWNKSKIVCRGEY